jgi:beta-barrel assembly-enhancing protease
MMKTITTYWAKQRVAALGLFAIVAINSVVYVGCSNFNLFSKQDDIALGQQVAAEIAANPQEYPVLNNPAATQYVQNIVNTILQSPGIKNRNFNYKVTLINDDKTINAFSIPGGPMYVYTGLMKYIDNEATLAGIMGHEITHADERHATERMTTVYGMQIVASIALGQAPGMLTEIAAGLAGNLAVLKFSRDDEREGDENSFNLLNTIPGKPYYPAAIRYFMIKTLNASKSQPGALENLLATHPPSQERLDNVDKMAKDAGLTQPTEANLKSTQFAQVRNNLGSTSVTGSGSTTSGSGSTSSGSSGTGSGTGKTTSGGGVKR